MQTKAKQFARYADSHYAPVETPHTPEHFKYAISASSIADFATWCGGKLIHAFPDKPKGAGAYEFSDGSRAVVSIINGFWKVTTDEETLV